MRIDIDHLTLPEPEAVALLKSEVRRLESVIAASQPTFTAAEREAVEWRRKGIIVYSAGTVVATIATAVLFLSLLWFAK